MNNITICSLISFFFFIGTLLIASLAYSAHCPSISNIVKEGKWHQPNGWKIIYKNGKPNPILYGYVLLNKNLSKISCVYNTKKWSMENSFAIFKTVKTIPTVNGFSGIKKNSQWHLEGNAYCAKLKYNNKCAKYIYNYAICTFMKNTKKCRWMILK